MSIIGNGIYLGGSSSATLVTKSVTSNGTYNASDDSVDGYASVTVDVPPPTLINKEVSANGTYQASADNADGYSSVTVAVGEYDMSVTANQFKMVVEIPEGDKSLWTRIAGSGNAKINWGDGNEETISLTTLLEYAAQKKHNYTKAGKYLVSCEALTGGSLTIGSVNSYCTLVEGDIVDYMNSTVNARKIYLLKLLELSVGDNVNVAGGLRSIPRVFFHQTNNVNFILNSTAINSFSVKYGTETIGPYWFASTVVYKIKIPSSVTYIRDNAFDGCAARILDFTDYELDSNNELPVAISSSNVFRSTSTLPYLVFKTQEIAEVAKISTNWSVYASRIKYADEIQM